MTDPTQLLNALRRPKLLLDAVRYGLQEYRRDRVLRRLLGATVCPGPRRAFAALVALEEEMEAARRHAQAGYNPGRHIEALVALISEARTLSADAARAASRGRRGPAAPRRRALKQTRLGFPVANLCGRDGARSHCLRAPQ